MKVFKKPNLPSTSKVSRVRSVDHPAVVENDVKKNQQQVEITNQLHDGVIDPLERDVSKQKPLKCEEVECVSSQKVFERNDLLKIHKAFEHDGVLDVESKHSVYYVQPDINSESYMKAFGLLYFKNGILFDKENLHCKLCNIQGVLIQFSRLAEPKLLLDHVVSHLQGIKFAESAK